MIVWITHVKVGHRQTPHPKNPLRVIVGGFLLPGILNIFALVQVVLVVDNQSD